MRKSTLAKAALVQLNGIREMGLENREIFGNRDENACYMHAARSASNYIKAIRAHDDAMLPEWLTRNWIWFASLGWCSPLDRPKAAL